MKIEFSVRGLPVPQGSAKAFPNPNGGSIVVTQTPKLKAWREAIASEARKVAPSSLITECISIDMVFNFDRPKSRKKDVFMVTRPDIDKLARAVLDGCTDVIWKDDSQVYNMHAFKGYGVPGVYIIITSPVNTSAFVSSSVTTKTISPMQMSLKGK